MTSKRHTSVNHSKLIRVEAVYQALVEEVLQAGFHGVAKLELIVSDGTIQRICRTVERIDRDSN